MSDDRSREPILEEIREGYAAGRQPDKNGHLSYRGQLLPLAALNRPDLQTQRGDSKMRPQRETASGRSLVWFNI
jgi:hypothetical protein